MKLYSVLCKDLYGKRILREEWIYVETIHFAVQKKLTQLVNQLQKVKETQANFRCLLGNTMGFPGGLVVKNPPANAGDAYLILGLGRSHRIGNGNLLQWSCLEVFMDRGV